MHRRSATPSASIRLSLLLVTLAGAAQPVLAQSDTDEVQRLERRLQELDRDYRLTAPADQPIAERALIDAGGSIRTGFFSIDDSESNAHYLRQFDGRLYLRAEFDGAHRFYGRLRFLYNDWNDGDDFDDRGDFLEHPLGDEYWYQFDLRSLERAQTGEESVNNFNIKVGRQFVTWTTGLTLDQPLYAALADIELGGLGIVALAGVTPEETVIDFDGSRPGYDTETQRGFFGGLLEWRAMVDHRPYIFFLSQKDMNDQDEFTFTNGVDTFPTEFEYNSNYLGAGSRGNLSPKLRYRAEFVYEFGDNQSNTFDLDTGAPVTQTEEDISAFAGVFGLTYLFMDPGDTRLDFEMVAGSGDDDRGDSADTFGGNEPGTDDTSFNGFGYANSGLAVGFEPSNLFSLRLGASFTPFSESEFTRNMRFGVDGYLFNKIDDEAPISVSTDDGEGFVGGEIDLFFNWRILSDLTFTTRYGVFLPGDAMPEDEDDSRHFLYLGMTYAF